MSNKLDPATTGLDDTLALGTRETGVSVPEPQAVRRIGPYRLLQLIGEGGMGEVWLAEQVEPVHRRVAVKLIKAGMDTKQVVARFESERQALALMDHPAIAKVFDGGSTPEGRPYFVMEYVAGVPITEHCDTHKLTTSARLELLAEVCEGVQHAHQKAIIHRDLKPSNILISFVDGKPQPKIIDFGIAKATGYRLTERTLFTEVGAIIGTPEYMSPEQADLTSQDVDTRTDVYSLGVILYQLLTGELPFASKDLRSSSYEELRRKLKEVEPLRPSTKFSTLGDAAADAARNRDTEPGALRRLLEGDLDAITMKALEKDRGRRYATPSELAADMARHLRHEPVAAQPASTAYRVRKYIRRHRLGVGLATGLAALLVVFAVAMGVQAARVKKERDRATAEAAKASAINAFLQDALGAADPWTKGARNVSLLDALRQAQAKAEAALKEQPLVESAVLETIGTTLSGLGEFTEAEKAQRTALELRVAATGPRSAETGSSLNALTGLYNQWGKLDEAQKSGREALDIARQQYGPRSLEAAAASGELAQVLDRKGQMPEAKALAEEMLQIARQRHSTTAAQDAQSLEAERAETQALGILASLALERGDYKTAESLTRERLVRLRARYGERHPKVASALNDMALVKMDTGDLAGAERDYKELLEMEIALLGENHPEVASVRENLGNVYFRSGRLDETARSLEVVLAMRRKMLGDDAEPVSRTLANMGVVYNRAGKYEAAERSLREALQGLSRTLGPEHLDVGTVWAELGSVLRKEGRFEEAVAALRHALDIRVKGLGEGHASTQKTLKALADTNTALGKKAEAAAYTARLLPAK